MRLVIELKDNRELSIYADQDVEITVIDWREVAEEQGDLPIWSKDNPIAEAHRKLLHKTTGLKQVY